MMPRSRSSAGLTIRHACILALLAVAGCASDTIDVQRQTSLPAAGVPARFVVILTPDEEAEPAFRRYAGILAAELRAHGMVAVSDPRDARYAVMFDESWHSTPSGLRNANSASDGSLGGSHGVDALDPGGAGGAHDAPAEDTSAHLYLDTVQGKVRIGVFDLTRPRSSQERVFHADVRAKAPADGDDAIVGAMIKAALMGFPGKTEESYSVPVPKSLAKG